MPIAEQKGVIQKNWDVQGHTAAMLYGFCFINPMLARIFNPR